MNTKYDILPSGAYRVRPYYEGKRYTLTFDHKPSESDIINALSQKVLDAPKTHPNATECLSFEQAVKSYIELKKDRNSPRTAKEYNNLLNRFSDGFKKKRIDRIKQIEVDREVAEWLKEGLAYKTMHNYFSMMQTVITKFGGQKFEMSMLPEKPKKEEPYIPTREDVKRLMEYIKVHYPRIYVPFYLSAYGLRRGEAAALTLDDIDFENAVIHIRHDMVQNVDRQWVVKAPKTQVSIRDVAVSRDLIEEIKTRGLYQTNPHTVNKMLGRAEKALGITHFSLHKMRHYACTELYEMGFNENLIMAYMGWEEESEIMRTVYKHSRLKSDKEKQRELADRLSQTWS